MKREATAILASDSLASRQVIHANSAERIRSCCSGVERNLRALGWPRGNSPEIEYQLRLLKGVAADENLLEAVATKQTSYPHIIEFQPGTVCPCACVFCFSKGERGATSPRSGYQPGAGDVLLNVDEMLATVEPWVEAGHCKSVYFSGGLEPFSSSATLPFLERMPPEPAVRIYTSGVAGCLTRSGLSTVVERATSVRFSVHAATAETYQAVQVPNLSCGDTIFDQVIDRIKTAVELRDHRRRASQPSASIGVTFLSVPGNYREVEMAVGVLALRRRGLFRHR